MDLEAFVVGVLVGLAPGLVLGSFLLPRGVAAISVMGRDLAGLVKNFTRAPSGPGGGLMGLAAQFLPAILAKK